MKTAFIYSGNFGSYAYSAGHPMRPVRLKLTFELIKALGLDALPSSNIIEARQASRKELLLFHTLEYIKALKEANTGIIPIDGPSHGLGLGDNPVFKGVYDWSCLSAGASLQAAEAVATDEADIAFNVAGGLHHAMPSRASGFCYINDAAIAIKYLAGLGKRVAYVDIDAHHGDGVEYAFYDSDKVLTISIHENGNWLFPGTGFATDIGAGKGRGYSVNLPLPPETGDAVFTNAFNRIVPPFIEAFKPDILVTQLGVDTFDTDPITHLSLTTNGFERMVRSFKSFNIPWVALGGGGYDLSNVARAWTLAWTIMNDMEPPETIPDDFLQKNSDIFRSKFLRDEPIKPLPFKQETLALIQNDIDYLLKEVLPMIKSSARL
ncbi:MAG: acetoin utilization protein AcuC [Deltaproteobacteria bacterium]|nr:acetoin utilization protein AcuC [Deltaproteobacteria bacterium]